MGRTVNCAPSAERSSHWFLSHRASDGRSLEPSALKDPNNARALVAGWEGSPFVLIRRMYLFAVASETVFPAREAWSALEALDDELFWGGAAQVEIMRLATGRWQDFESAEREKFEARVRSGLPRELFSPEAFPVEEDWTVAKDAAAYKRLARLQAVGWPVSAASQATLGEILGRHPKWTLGPSDREDFAVWHESRSGPDGQPELLAGVKDEALVSEAMRLQRERVYDQGDIWRVLTEADPERALRALKLEASASRFEPMAWRDLLWAASNQGDAELQIEVANAVLGMPADILRELLPAAASWLQRRRESLKGDPPEEADFLRIWDRLAAVAYPQDSGPIEEGEKDLVSLAINDPAGTLAWTFLDHIADQRPMRKTKFRGEYSKRLNLTVNAPGRAGLLARVLLGRSLAYIKSIAPSWAATNLVPCLSWDRPHAAAMWGAFAGGGHVGTSRLFNAVKAPMLDAFARRGLGEHDLEALISQLLAIEFAHRRGELGGYMLTPAEIKRVLSVGAHSTRATAAWLLWRAMGEEKGEPADKSARWREIVGPVFRDIWPLDSRFRDEQVSERLVLMTLECEDAFDDAVNAVIDFVVPYRLYLIAHSLRLQKEHDALVRRYPRASLRLANALIDPAIHPVPNDLADFLELCVDADPSVTAEPTYIRLFGLRRLQGS